MFSNRIIELVSKTNTRGALGRWLYPKMYTTNIFRTFNGYNNVRNIPIKTIMRKYSININDIDKIDITANVKTVGEQVLVGDKDVIDDNNGMNKRVHIFPKSKMKSRNKRRQWYIDNKSNKRGNEKERMKKSKQVRGGGGGIGGGKDEEEQSKDLS